MVYVMWIGLIFLVGILVIDIMFFGTFIKIILMKSDSDKMSSYLATPDGIIILMMLLFCTIVAGICGFFIYKLMLALNVSFGTIWHEIKHFTNTLYHQIPPVTQRITLKSVLMILLGITGLGTLGCTVFFWAVLQAGIGGNRSNQIITFEWWIMLLLMAIAGVVMLWLSIKNLFL